MPAAESTALVGGSPMTFVVDKTTGHVWFLAAFGGEDTLLLAPPAKGQYGLQWVDAGSPASRVWTLKCNKRAHALHDKALRISRPEQEAE